MTQITSTNIERELGKLEAKNELFEKRIQQIEQDLKNEVNNVKNDLKEMKKEIQIDFKELKTSVNDIKNAVAGLEKFDNNTVSVWKTITFIGSISVSIISFGYTVFKHFYP